MRGRAFQHDERGTVAILSALSLTVVVGAGALAIDVGSVYLDRRAAQAAADLAAMSAASDLPRARANALATITQNRLPADTPFTVDVGTYTPDASRDASDRFRVSAAATAGVGSDAWLDAQTALAELDGYRAESTAAVSTLDELAIARASNAQPAYPALDSVHQQGEAQVAAESETIATAQNAVKESARIMRQA